MRHYLTSRTISVKRWVILTIISIIVYVVSVYGFNYCIDPFGNRNWLVKKQYKPIVHERSEKYTYIFHQKNIEKYDCLILGSSRVMSINSSDNKNETCYNFGVHVANNAEKLFILEEWLKRAPLKTVYLGNELYNFHANAQQLHLDPLKFTHGLESNYLSIPALSISFKALRNQLFDQPQTYFTKDGIIRYIVKENAIRSTTFEHSPANFINLSKQKLQNDYIIQPFSYERKAIEPLQQIKGLCDWHHVKLYAFITPTYSELHSNFDQNSILKAANNRFRKDLVSTFKTVYDFDVNHAFNANPKNFYDSVHYRPYIGELIYNRFRIDNGYGTIIKDSDAL